jgi:putative intracellular protease/amidase
MSKKILAILSNHGYWGVELTGPMLKLEAAGYELEFCTPKGERPIALPPSYDTTYIDPPLGYNVTTPEDAAEVISVKDCEKLDNPINLSEWFPERPYYCAPDFLRRLEEYYKTIKQRQNELAKYDGLLLVGGSGPIVDMVNNQRVHEVILGFYKLNKPIAAICYGVACLAFARDFNERKSLIKVNMLPAIGLSSIIMSVQDLSALILIWVRRHMCLNMY